MIIYTAFMALFFGLATVGGKCGNPAERLTRLLALVLTVWSVALFLGLAL